MNFNQNLLLFCPKRFHCKKCDYTTSKKSSFDDHLMSAKHGKETDFNHIVNQNLLLSAPKKIFSCTCGKTYKEKSGLWKHKKLCLAYQTAKDEENIKRLNESGITPDNYDDNSCELITANSLCDKDLILMLIKQNSELMDMLKAGTNTITNSHNITNSNNKSFNLQFFLNETCKDAMNISDFVNSIKIDLDDLENMGRVGYVEGISNIIVKNLNALDVTERPIHCTDHKRETMYIKDEDKWEKEDDGKKRIRTTIKRVANKNINLLKKFREKYPDCESASSRHSDRYCKMIIEVMGGPGDNDEEKENKIIKNISKHVTIQK